MESSANLHPHHHKQQYVRYSSLVAQTGHPWPAVLSTTDHDLWSPNHFPNNSTIIGGKYNYHRNNNNNNLSETNNIIPKSSRDVWAAVAQPNLMIRSSSSMNEDSCDDELVVANNIKDEMSDNSFPKVLSDDDHEMIMYSHSHSHSHSTTTAAHDHHNSYNSPISNKKQYYPQISSSSDDHDHHHDLGENLWHNTKFSVANNNMTTDLQLSYTNGHDDGHQSPCLGSTEAAAASRYDHMFPSTNIISTSDLCSTLLFPSSLDLNLKSLDLLTTSGSTYHDHHGGNQYNLLDYHHSPPAAAAKLSIPMGQDHRRSQLSDSTQPTSSKVSAFVSGLITSSKRPAAAASFSHQSTKESHTVTDAKKQRSMSRSPCPTLKVRKEKLGDRVAALQKLVAPFGKTDTSTVLTEAIGYIQFLHDQVQTLSVPFMKSSPSKLYRTVQVGTKGEEGKEEQKPDLGSKGLCLVPQSYASYFVNSCSSGI